MSSTASFKVGLIIGSARVVRVGPQIASFVLSTIRTATTITTASTPSITIDTIDLKTVNLPMFDEPGIPMHITSANGYTHAHTRAWSSRIAVLDAFVFVTPQRNWGYPAELKNAIDYLRSEWTGKSAMIVTYGGHGGNEGGDQLRTVLGSMGMRLVDRKVGMKFPDAEFRGKCFRGEELGLDAERDGAVWAEYRPVIVAAWEDLVEKLGEGR